MRVNKITKEQENEVIDLFYSINNNTTTNIANIVGLKPTQVSKAIDKHLKIKIDELNDRIKYD